MYGVTVQSHKPSGCGQVGDSGLWLAVLQVSKAGSSVGAGHQSRSPVESVGGIKGRDDAQVRAQSGL